MAKLFLKKMIEAPVDVVFAKAADIENVADWSRGILRIEMLTESPVGDGTRFRETRRVFNKEATEVMAISAFKPNQSYTVSSLSMGVAYSSVLRFKTEGKGTLVEMDFRSRPLTLAAKLFSPLAWMMMGTMKKCMEGDLEDLKQAIESGSPPPAA